MELNDIEIEQLEEHVRIFKDRMKADEEALAFNSFVSNCFDEYLKKRNKEKKD